MASATPLPIWVKADRGVQRLGNKLLQVSLARHLATLLERPSVICGIDIPPLRTWIPFIPPPEVSRPLVLDRADCNRGDLAFVPGVVAALGHDAIVLEGWGTVLSHVRESRQWLIEMLDSLQVAPEPLADDELCIAIRLGDIGIDPPGHPDYSPLPIEFYLDVVGSSGLRPVFVGQMTEGPYLTDLRNAFPGARFIEPEVLPAFETIRRARHKVIAVSTFSWLAGWLGDEDTTIVLPVAGALNPLQRPDWDLLPLNDLRYTLRWFSPLPRSRQIPLTDHLVRWHAESQGYPEIAITG